MKRIDFYVQHLVRHNATGVVLTSGEPVLFQFPTGERKSNTPIEHAQVSQLVQEAAPSAAIESLRSSGRGEFEHTASGGVTVRVLLEARGPREWVVTLKPQGAGASQGRPAAVGIAAPQAEAAAVRA
ncbi:MAG: hypothetical protein RLP09_12125, partial [Sandaracinaceae bacterium]